MVLRNREGSVEVEFGWIETTSKKIKLFERTFLLYFSKETKTKEKVPILTRNAKEFEKKNQNRNPFIDTKCAGEKSFRIKGRTITYTVKHGKYT